MLDRTSTTLLNIFIKLLPDTFRNPEVFYKKNGFKTARWVKGSNIFEVTVLPTGFMESFISGAGAGNPSLGGVFFDGKTAPSAFVNQIAVTMGV